MEIYSPDRAVVGLPDVRVGKRGVGEYTQSRVERARGVPLQGSPYGPGLIRTNLADPPTPRPRGEKAATFGHLTATTGGCACAPTRFED